MTERVEHHLVLFLCAMLLGVCIPGCHKTYSCENDDGCVVGDLFSGICINHPDEGRYCAWSQPLCPSGWQWDTFAASSLSRRCVDPALVSGRGGSDGGAMVD